MLIAAPVCRKLERPLFNGEEHVEDQPLPKWLMALRLVPRGSCHPQAQKYKSPAGDVDLIRLGQ